MDREEFYLVAAPVFATYLGSVSGSEALKFASIATEELAPQEARRLFVASLMPTPSAHFLEDRLEVARQFGYVLAQEEAGAPRPLLVTSFLASMRSLAVSRSEAKMKAYEGVMSALGSLFVLPLFLAFMWAVGAIQLDPGVLYVAVLGTVAGLGAAAYKVAPRDLAVWPTYGWSLPAASVAAVLTALLSPPAAFLAFGGVLLAWLKAADRLWWTRVRGEVPAMLRSVAGMLREGAPPDVIMARLSARFRTAHRIAFGYFIPSRFYALARAMYRAIAEAGGSAAMAAVEYIQALVDVEVAAVRKMQRLAAAFFALYLAALVVVSYAASQVASAMGRLGEASGYVQQFLSPPPYEEVATVFPTLAALVAASYIAVFLMPSGLWLSTLAGGATGVALEAALRWLFQGFSPAL